jgi:hypothetical protein
MPGSTAQLVQMRLDALARAGIRRIVGGYRRYERGQQGERQE